VATNVNRTDVSELAGTKVCPLCAETIKAAAKVCPFCRSKQSRYARWRQELPVALVAGALGAMACAVITLLAPEEKGIGGRSFAGHRDELVVSSTSLDRATARPDSWLTGVITNRGKYPWRVHELEVRFVDERSGLLDVRHPDVKDLFVVQPRQEHAFRVKLEEVIFTNDRVTHQVRVQTATDGDRPSKPD
jgi:hypothetical protein